MAEVTLAVLAGGRSRRFGSNKALAPWDGKPMIAHVLERLAGAFPRRIVVAKDPTVYEALGLGVPLVPDAAARFHPLAGIVAALRAAGTPYVAAVGCDMPLASPALLQAVAAAARGRDAAVPLWEGHAQPLFGVYAAAAAEKLAALLEGPDLPCCRFLKEIDTRYLPAEAVSSLDPKGLTFLDTDTPEAFSLAREAAHAG